MKRWHFRRRRTWEHGQGFYALLLCGLAGIGLAFWLIASIEAQLTPVLASMAKARVNYVMTQALNTAVSSCIEAEGFDYSDIVSIEKNESGQIIALTSNMTHLNQLRTNLSQVAVNAVADLDMDTLSIPVGNLTGVNLFSGRGSSVPVEIVCVGSSAITFENRFTEAGINQTQHQIMLHLSINVDILLPGETLYTSIGVEVPLAETIIVGTVPSTYLEIKEPL